MSAGWFKKLQAGGISITATEIKTSASANLALALFGASLCSASTATKAFTLGPSPAPGVMKYVTLSTGANTVSVATTAALRGSTRKTLSYVGGKALLTAQKAPIGIMFVGSTGGRWALIACPSQSTAFTVA